MQTEPKIPSELTIIPARAGGYVVRGARGYSITSDRNDGPRDAEFAGSLPDCLGFIEAAFRPPMVVDPSAVSPEEMEKLRAMPPGEIEWVSQPEFVRRAFERAEPVDLSRLHKSARAVFQAGDEFGALMKLLEMARRNRTGGCVLNLDQVEILWDALHKPPVDLDRDLEDVLDSYRLAGRKCWVRVDRIDLVEAMADGRGVEAGRSRLFPGSNALADAAKWLREQLDSKDSK